MGVEVKLGIPVLDSLKTPIDDFGDEGVAATECGSSAGVANDNSSTVCKADDGRSVGEAKSKFRDVAAESRDTSGFRRPSSQTGPSVAGS